MDEDSRAARGIKGGGMVKRVVRIKVIGSDDVLFVSEKNENVWWYDGERIAFRTPNYTKILNAMRRSLTVASTSVYT